MKVSKEDIVGLVTAVEYWFKRRDLAAEQRRWQGDLETIAAKLGGVATTTIVAPEGVERVPRLRVTWDAERTGLDGNALRLKLAAGTPRIMLDDNSARDCSIEIDPFQLQPGEAAQVGDAVAVALSANAPAAAPGAPLTARVAGEWELTVRFMHGSRTHRLHIGQDGTAISGKHESPEFSGAVSGSLTPAGIAFRFLLRYEGSNIAYQFSGQVANDAMDGTVTFGTSSDHHGGPLNLAQFGSGSWAARRVA
jgi:hypothetical protein